MASINELAEEYAEILRDTKATLKKSASVTAQVRSSNMREFREALIQILAEVDNLYHEKTAITQRRYISTAEKMQLFGQLDILLKKPAGTFQMLKKGSVEMGLKFEQMVQDLYDSIEFV